MRVEKRLWDKIWDEVRRMKKKKQQLRNRGPGGDWKADARGQAPCAFSPRVKICLLLQEELLQGWPWTGRVLPALPALQGGDAEWLLWEGEPSGNSCSR